VKRVLLTVAITVVVNSLIASHPTAAEQRAARTGPERRQIVTGPALESATHDTAIIRWTVSPSGGTVTQYGIVRYSTDPKNLDHIAKSPNRWNRTLPNMTYRVRIDGLTPGTTYYYTVDAALADGIPMGLKSPTKQFSTPPQP
jgi:phosphodiesterase/alkaline phosphatase D-like protein